MTAATIKIESVMYGCTVAKIVAVLLTMIGVNRKRAIKISKAFLLVKVTGLGRTKWVWGGSI